MSTEILYVVVDSVTGYPVLGGGSSSPPYIRAFTNESSAEKCAKRIKTANTWNKSVVSGKPIVVSFERVIRGIY